ncbi:MAG: hypothetical protein ACLFSQ_03370 [Candidatus Zixiibacteriota bacterium]
MRFVYIKHYEDFSIDGVEKPRVEVAKILKEKMGYCPKDLKFIENIITNRCMFIKFVESLEEAVEDMENKKILFD